MIRKLSCALLLGLVCTFAVGADDDTPGKGKGKFGGKGGFDKGKMFEKMDANGDGKVTKEEYTKFFEAIQEKMKDKVGDKGGKGKAGEFITKMYEKLDPKGTGSFTKEQFEKAEFGPPGGGKGDFKGKFKGKKNPSDD